MRWCLGCVDSREDLPRRKARSWRSRRGCQIRYCRGDGSGSWVGARIDLLRIGLMLIALQYPRTRGSLVYRFGIERSAARTAYGTAVRLSPRPEAIDMVTTPRQCDQSAPFCLHCLSLRSGSGDGAPARGEPELELKPKSSGGFGELGELGEGWSVRIDVWCGDS
jgi:hypothetical protein